MSAVSPSKYNRIELQKKGKDPVELKGGVVSVDYYESLYSPDSNCKCNVHGCRW